MATRWVESAIVGAGRYPGIVMMRLDFMADALLPLEVWSKRSVLTSDTDTPFGLETLDSGKYIVGIFNHGGVLQYALYLASNSQELYRYNINIYQLNSYTTVKLIIKVSSVTCCQELILFAIKETSTSDLFIGRLLMPDRRSDQSPYPREVGLYSGFPNYMIIHALHVIDSDSFQGLFQNS